MTDVENNLPPQEPEVLSIDEIPVQPPVVAPEVLSIDDILNDRDVIVQKEASDRAILMKIADTPIAELRPLLLAWAQGGVPDAYRLFSVSVTPPPVCSDGVTREFFPYAEYVLGAPVNTYMTQLQNKLIGMTLSYSINPNEIAIHVTKKQ